jgi:ATP-dependent Clp protease ATP-binding subunit ClpA
MAHPATIDRVGTELSLLRLHADELARQRKETTTTCHVLATIAEGTGPIRDLLRERSLTPERILENAERSVESKPSIVDRAFNKAVELARRMGQKQPTAAHLLMAILSDASAQGRRCVERLSVDVARLRSQAWNISIGWPSRTATATRAARSPAAE